MSSGGGSRHHHTSPPPARQQQHRLHSAPRHPEHEILPPTPHHLSITTLCPAASARRAALTHCARLPGLPPPLMLSWLTRAQDLPLVRARDVANVLLPEGDRGGGAGQGPTDRGVV